MSPPSEAPAAVIFGCAGPELTPDEAALFRAVNPLGFILFAKNCDTPAQVRHLVETLRDTVGRADAPVLIDQEGGSVRRLRPPQWDDVPPAALFGQMFEHDREKAVVAAELCGRLIAAQLAPLGITVTCAPVLDVSFPDTSSVIGDRAFGSDPAVIVELARAFCKGLADGGVLPVIKHIPGHGRATVDSHLDVPRVAATAAALQAIDFAPFRELASQPLGMTAHVVYEALDPDNVATVSATMIGDIIRGEIGFDGFLMTDDIGMGALKGDIATRSAAALGAGCDAILHCSGDFDEMQGVGAVVPPLTEEAHERWRAAAAQLSPVSDVADAAELAAQLSALIDHVGIDVL
ncbi:MAG: beta-N-acetylhexosaminidase [Alphaproteobacteria bacterium]|nr:beta-N-acetylhexosaminidase [Alphaproteobacteria bacterium]